MNKIIFLFFMWAYKALFVTRTEKLDSNFQHLVDMFSKFSFNNESMVEICIHYRFNLEILDFQKIDQKKTIGRYLEDFRPLFELFVADPAKSKQKIKSKVSAIIKDDIRAILPQFMLYDTSVKDVLEAAPDVYYEKSLETINWKPEVYLLLLSNIRRLGWLLEALETGVVSKANNQLLNECVAEFKGTIDHVVDIINEDVKADTTKEDSGSVLKLLGDIKSRFDEECQKLKSDEGTDWSDFEPLVLFALEGRADGFKKIRDKYAEAYKAIDEKEVLILEPVTSGLMGAIFYAYKSAEIDDRLKSLVAPICQETLQQVMAAWNTLIKSMNGFANKNSDQRHSLEGDFYKFFNSFLSYEHDQIAFDFFFEQMYQKANGLRSQLSSLKPANDPHLMSHFIALIEKINPKFRAGVDTDIQSNFKTYCFLLCFFASGVSLEEFKKLGTFQDSIAFITIYSHIDQLDPKILEFLSPFANFLAKSKLLPLNKDVLHAYIYWVSKYIWSYFKHELNFSRDFAGLDQYLSETTEISKKDPINMYLNFLRLIILAEDPNDSYCCWFLKLNDDQMATMTKLLETPEYSRLYKCLKTNDGKSVNIQAQIAGPNPSDKLNISVNLKEENIVGNKLLLTIDLLENNQYEVTPTLTSATSSASRFVNALKTKKGLCKPDNFKLESCLVANPGNLLI